MIPTPGHWLSYVGFARWSFAIGPFLAHIHKEPLGAQEGEPAVDVGEGVGLAGPLCVPWRDGGREHRTWGSWGCASGTGDPSGQSDGPLSAAHTQRSARVKAWPTKKVLRDRAFSSSPRARARPFWLHRRRELNSSQWSTCRARGQTTQFGKTVFH